MSYLVVDCETLPQAWEEAVLRCWEEGERIRTEYDRPNDPESRDCTAFIIAHKPFQEPRIHKAFPGSLESLEIYRQEVTLGIHDSWVDPAAGKAAHAIRLKGAGSAFAVPGGKSWLVQGPGLILMDSKKIVVGAGRQTK